MLISLFISEGLGHQWQVKVSTKLIVIKTDSSFQSASEYHFQIYRVYRELITVLVTSPVTLYIVGRFAAGRDHGL